MMVASIGYSATFGAHDSTVLGRGLVADVAVPPFLLLAAPAVFVAAPPATPQAESSGMGW